MVGHPHYLDIRPDTLIFNMILLFAGCNVVMHAWMIEDATSASHPAVPDHDSDGSHRWSGILGSLPAYTMYGQRQSWSLCLQIGPLEIRPELYDKGV